MGLSELISLLDLWVYPVVGLLGFCLAFALQAVRVARTSGDEMLRCGNIPLDDDTTEARSASAARAANTGRSA